MLNILSLLPTVNQSCTSCLNPLCQNWIGVEEMKRTKYTAEFKEEAVKQVIDKGHTVDV